MKIFFNFELVVTFDHAPSSGSIYQTDRFFSASAENGQYTVKNGVFINIPSGGRRLGLTGMAASCDFCEILACWRWVWWGVLLEFAETKNNYSACNSVVEPKAITNNY